VTKPLPDLSIALDPRSIAVIGASENPNKIGGRPLAYLRRFGFKGSVYAVNPRRSETQGWPTWPSIKDLPEAPELAIVAVPGEAAVEAIDACGEAGVKIAVLITSGFGESDPAAGKVVEAAMVARARARGMRIVGPNSQGLANFATGAIASFSTMFIEVEPEDGPVGIVSQSGAMSVVPYGLLRQRGIGIRHSHATGNDGDVSVAELATAVARDPGLRLLLLYLESITDAAHLAALAETARERRLPIIALKAGRTPAGQQAARSHTGALANEDRLVDAWLEAHGILRARTTTELVAGVELYLKGWQPTGRRLVAISNSGATCVMAADAAADAGLALDPLAPATREALGRILPTFASTVNPVDITAALLTNSRLFSDILPIIAEDPAADAFLVGVPVAGTGYDVDAFGRDTAAFAAATGKPIVVAAPQPLVAARFAAAGLPVFADEAIAVAALARFIDHHAILQQARPARAPRSTILQRAGKSTTALNEAEALDLLAGRGAPVVRFTLVQDETAAIAAFRSFGGPVVLKSCSRDILHKTELGLVCLGLVSEDAVLAAYRDLQARVAASGHRLDGIIVAEMASGRREILIGAHVDPVFGPAVVVGDGGRYVEHLPDLQLLFPPFTTDEVLASLRRLRIAPVLAGTRGEPALDLDAVARLAVLVGELLLDDEVNLASLDLNPVLAGAAGEGCRVLDAVALLASGSRLAVGS
jgi:acyl-CoA synthetase (NDP forming)